MVTITNYCLPPACHSINNSQRHIKTKLYALPIHVGSRIIHSQRSHPHPHRLSACLCRVHDALTRRPVGSGSEATGTDFRPTYVEVYMQVPRLRFVCSWLNERSHTLG